MSTTTTPTPEVVREKLTLTKQEAQDILWGENEGFAIISDEIVGKRRWVVCHQLIVCRKADGKFFRARYDVGATESQDEAPFEHTEPTFTEVFPTQKTITVYT